MPPVSSHVTVCAVTVGWPFRISENDNGQFQKMEGGLYQLGNSMNAKIMERENSYKCLSWNYDFIIVIVIYSDIVVQ